MTVGALLVLDAPVGVDARRVDGFAAIGDAGEPTRARTRRTAPRVIVDRIEAAAGERRREGERAERDRADSNGGCGGEAVPAGHWCSASEMAISKALH